MTGTTEWAEMMSVNFFFPNGFVTLAMFGGKWIEGLLQPGLHCTLSQIEYCGVITSDYETIVLQIDLV